MRWGVFADLSRRLGDGERHAVFAAIDELVPDSGCVGPGRSGDEEVWFIVEAPDEAAARRLAAGLMDRVLAAAGVDVGHAITLQRR